MYFFTISSSCWGKNDDKDNEVFMIFFFLVLIYTMEDIILDFRWIQVKYKRRK